MANIVYNLITSRAQANVHIYQHELNRLYIFTTHVDPITCSRAWIQSCAYTSHLDPITCTFTTHADPITCIHSPRTCLCYLVRIHHHLHTQLSVQSIPAHMHFVYLCSYKPKKHLSSSVHGPPFIMLAKTFLANNNYRHTELAVHTQSRFCFAPLLP